MRLLFTTFIEAILEVITNIAMTNIKIVGYFQMIKIPINIQPIDDNVNAKNNELMLALFIKQVEIKIIVAKRINFIKMT